MNAQEFTNLYIKKNKEENLTTFQGEVGFSLVRQYPKETPYEKDGKKMFIKVVVLNKGLFYSVDMTKPEKNGDDFSYILTDGSEYKKNITNFISDVESNEFSFDQQVKKIIHTKTKKQFSLNEFIEVLVYNHLSDRLFWKRKKNYFVNRFLKIFFWLVDDYYDHIKVSIDRYHFSRGEKIIQKNEKNLDPFFKYFYISKNILFSLFLISFPLAFFFGYLWSSGDFSASNPTIILLFFLILFSCEKTSHWLDKKIKDFLIPENNVFSKKTVNFIEKLHQYQQRNNFDLKLESGSGTHSFLKSVS